MERLDEEREDRKKQLKELKTEFEKIERKNAELERKIEKIEAENQAGRSASNIKWNEMEKKIENSEKKMEKETANIKKGLKEMKEKLIAEVVEENDARTSISTSISRMGEGARIAEIEG
ncbi:Protein of unknown function [Cotesia congregata]|uniref:Uncharacterized protein n=1 Tax=Cotesia congregata TaxID=51543 RepID=A0A8J2H908_COTCN|nr:Protein of unknown function [Cotesia congregata]